MTDKLDDEMGRKVMSRVEVWENERLDTSKGGGGGWGSRFLRGGERAPWVKVRNANTLWAEAERDVEEEKGGSTLGLGLKDRWEWIEGEEWRVDVSGLWSEVGVDEGVCVFTYIFPNDANVGRWMGVCGRLMASRYTILPFAM
jgi:hypothetical protein